jgi:HEAT repeat protein
MNQPTQKAEPVQKAEIDLLHEDPRVRLVALDELVLDGMPACYAAREVLLGDSDARVRARAAERLGQAAGAHAEQVAAWLLDAAEDVFPLVRDASLRALARLLQRSPASSASGARARVARLALLDPIWWVRRAAALVLTALAEEAAIPTLRRVLGDPFWRVRHAAVQALTLLGGERPHVRSRILSEATATSPSCRRWHRWRCSRCGRGSCATSTCTPSRRRSRRISRCGTRIRR